MDSNTESEQGLILQEKEVYQTEGHDSERGVKRSRTWSEDMDWDSVLSDFTSDLRAGGTFTSSEAAASQRDLSVSTLSAAEYSFPPNLNWTQDEEKNLERLVKEHGGDSSSIDWEKIAESFPQRSALFISRRWKECQSPTKKLQYWTKEEDEILAAKYEEHGSNWGAVQGFLTGRAIRSIRRRFHTDEFQRFLSERRASTLESVSPSRLMQIEPASNIKNWTKDEDEILAAKHGEYGNRWTELRTYLPGRTEISIKRHFFTNEFQRFMSERDTATGGAVSPGSLLRTDPASYIKKWTREEAEILAAKYEVYGNNWGAFQEFLTRRTKVAIGKHFHTNEFQKFMSERRASTGESVSPSRLMQIDPASNIKKWTKDEDEILAAKHREHGNRWTELKNHLPGRTEISIKNRFLTNEFQKFMSERRAATGESVSPGSLTQLIPASNIKNWTKEEDEILAAKYEEHGNNWVAVQEFLTRRTKESIGRRFRADEFQKFMSERRASTGESVSPYSLQYRKKWTKEEDKILAAKYEEHGKNWAKLEECLPGRNENSIRNHINSAKFQSLMSNRRASALEPVRTNSPVLAGSTAEGDQPTIDSGMPDMLSDFSVPNPLWQQSPSPIVAGSTAMEPPPTTDDGMQTSGASAEIDAALDLGLCGNPNEDHLWMRNFPDNWEPTDNQDRLMQIDPASNKKKWTKDEDEILAAKHGEYGNRWTELKKYLPGRTESSIKSHFHTDEFKRFLSEMRAATGEPVSPGRVMQLDLASNKQKWTKEEDEILAAKYEEHGNNSAKLKEYLPGRTKESIRQHLYSIGFKNFKAKRSIPLTTDDGMQTSGASAEIDTALDLGLCGNPNEDHLWMRNFPDNWEPTDNWDFGSSVEPQG